MSNSDEYYDAGEDDDDILDLAASLGGSLMKDLLADLAVNEDDAQEWLHLEQLERELHHLDLTSAAEQQQQHQTAAGMVVSSHASAAAQAFGTGSSLMTLYSNNYVVDDEDNANNNNSALDAWSLSLQKFTASSVAADFLQADSARKQQQETAAAPSRPPPGMLAMEDYDITSTATVPLPRGPPPGISATTAGKQVISQAAAKLVQDLQTVQEETISPQTNKKSVVVPPVTVTQDLFKTPDEIESPEEGMENSAISRSEASTPLLVRQLQKGLQAVHETEVLQDDHDDDNKIEIVSQPQTTSRVPKPVPITPHNSMGYAPSSMKTTPTPQPTPIASKPMNQAALTDAMPPMPLMPPVMAVPLPAWSSQHPPPPMPRRVVFANPHPAAAPMHAEQLVSRYMTARDICYVVHSLMRPLLTAETAGLVSNYHVQYWTRHYPNPPPPPPAEKTMKQHSTKDWLAHEFESRAKKAHAWSESNQTLGTPSKTNVTRPRALVSVTHGTFHTTTTTDRDPSKQRAALWKARIYCDQAYQALQDVTDRWKLHGRAAAQTPLLKLFKCLGIGWQLMGAAADNTTDNAAAEVHQQYSVDPTALQLLLQLAKGKVLLARVLEQALLPPTVIPVLLPVALELQCSSRTANNSNSISKSEELDVADDRVFGAWTAVLRTLPMIPGEALVTTVSQIQKYPDTALATTARMQCVHALLQRGGELAAAASTDGHHNSAFAKQWAQTEQEFMSILA